MAPLPAIKSGIHVTFVTFTCQRYSIFSQQSSSARSLPRERVEGACKFHSNSTIRLLSRNITNSVHGSVEENSQACTFVGPKWATSRDPKRFTILHMLFLLRRFPISTAFPVTLILSFPIILPHSHPRKTQHLFQLKYDHHKNQSPDRLSEYSHPPWDSRTLVKAVHLTFKLSKISQPHQPSRCLTQRNPT